MPNPPTPLLTRIKSTTVATPDVEALAAVYKTWLGYAAVERGTVGEALAACWGTPAMAGRPFVTMRPASKADVYIRAVEIDPVPGHKPMTTWGWNAIELIVDDPIKLNRKLSDSPFLTIGRPRPLRRFPSIVATQVRGPAAEILYLTAETGDRSKSLLPPPGAAVGRPFIMVVATGDTRKTRDWYARHFKTAKTPINDSPVDVLQRAQGLPPDHMFQMALARLAQHGNMIEIDGYPPGTGPRPRHHGQLPPGVAMTSFGTASLDNLKVKFLAPPVAVKGAGYEGRRAACVVGSAGELIELIEE